MLGRVRKELSECQKEVNLSGVSAATVNGNEEHLKGILVGPSGTPYAGGEFHIDIRIPKNYPFEPPRMQFDTKIWHPNVSSQTGAICLDILKDQWSPALTIKTALLSIQALLSAAEPSDPQDAQVADQYIRDFAAFETTAKYWTESYARPRSTTRTQDAVDAASLQRLCDMGFVQEQVVAALLGSAGDENAALETLLSTANVL